MERCLESILVTPVGEVSPLSDRWAGGLQPLVALHAFQSAREISLDSGIGYFQCWVACLRNVNTTSPEHPSWTSRTAFMSRKRKQVREPTPTFFTVNESYWMSMQDKADMRCKTIPTWLLLRRGKEGRLSDKTVWPLMAATR